MLISEWHDLGLILGWGVDLSGCHRLKSLISNGKMVKFSLNPMTENELLWAIAACGSMQNTLDV
jgi:hypothetical protein